MTTIEPTIQETIINVLPEDYDTAISVMCQLLANMMLSGKGTDLKDIHNQIKKHLVDFGAFVVSESDG